MELLEEVFARVCKIAQAAALMTETNVDIRKTAGCSTVINNHYLADLQYEVMKEIGPIHYTDEELAFAEEINAAFPEGNRTDIFKSFLVPEGEIERVEAIRRRQIVDENFPAMDAREMGTGSTDVGDVSWLTPLSMLRTTCFPAGVSSHSWGATAASGISIGHKGMMHAAKIMACAAARLYTGPERLQKAREEFKKATAGRPYKCPAPADIRAGDLKATE